MTARARGLAVLLATGYALVFYRCYIDFLYAQFEYAGYDLFHREPGFLLQSLAIAVLPVLCHRGVRAISSIIAVLIYLMLYVPIIAVFTLGSSRPTPELSLIQLTFLAGMVLIFFADAIIIRNPLRLDVRTDLMPTAFALTVVSTLYIVAIYRGSMHFASFGADLYEQRDANSALGEGLVTRYLSSWLSTILVPLCLSHGLTRRQPRYTVAALVACLVLYMAAANKLAILIPLAYFAFYGVFRRRLAATMLLMTTSISALVLGMLALGQLGGASLVAAALVLHRTLGNGGQLTMAYYDFFAFHERTGYSHVHGLNLFTKPYPYGDLIPGQVVGQFYWSPFVNANANFWATDGLAAAGLPGVAIVSVLMALLFVVMNAVTEGYELLFVTLCFLPFVSTILNQSLFSGVWSGGAFFLILFFVFNRRPRPAAGVTDSHRPALVAG